ncbi:M50 family peptidase [Oceanobacillus piezotolerans]|uniref:M50 family peptidase n=1 Tax=Oceanobacillus piezotolerans TaxID=2448030 RepID=A0A498DI03_9BACI|nr:M50 family metallopeptidase [Oceanobacillus piezotolerans]RLL48159.1 M50 family peptidase [Oceanobacillus piezotolerans]
MIILLFFYLLLIVSPISIFFHELGHAIGAMKVKANSVSLTIGMGEKLFSLSMRNLSIVINKMYFMGGVTKSNRNSDYKVHEQVLISLMGPFANGVLSIILLILYFYFPNPNLYFEIGIGFNIWLFITNLLPIRIRGKSTDGYLILEALSTKHE